MDVCTRYLRAQQVPLHGDHHRRWPAEIDIAAGDVWNQLAQMSRRQEMCRRGVSMVADDIENLDASFACELVELSTEDQVTLTDGPVDKDKVTGHLLQHGAYR